MININGTLPANAILGEHLPVRTEVGIGALMPWADKLWYISYVAHKSGSGAGGGLYSMGADMVAELHPASVVGTYANRMIHSESNQAIIGPHVIDIHGNVRTAEALLDIRITATARHLSDPEHKVYMLGMEGEFYEMDVGDLTCTLIDDLSQTLGVTPGRGEGIRHFKGMYSAHGRVVVANNSYDECDHLGTKIFGRLAEWDGETWTIIQECQGLEVMGRGSIGNAILATGVDRASALLKVYIPGGPRQGWQTYRLPKATHTQDHAVTTEWPRIREVESERWMMNLAGMFYELPAMQYGGHVWGVRPVSTHLRIIGDYCSWRGLLVLAGDQTTPIWDKNTYVGQPQSNLWFGKTDDLWSFGKPSGWGGPWRDSAVAAGEASDPYLFCGFEHKCLHLRVAGGAAQRFRVELDTTGEGDWIPYASLSCSDGAVSHVFPTGLSAQWVRVVSEEACTVSAEFIYT